MKKPLSKATLKSALPEIIEVLTLSREAKAVGGDVGFLEYNVEVNKVLVVLDLIQQQFPNIAEPIITLIDQGGIRLLWRTDQRSLRITFICYEGVKMAYRNADPQEHLDYAIRDSDDFMRSAGPYLQFFVKPEVTVMTHQEIQELAAEIGSLTLHGNIPIETTMAFAGEIVHLLAEIKKLRTQHVEDLATLHDKG